MSGSKIVHTLSREESIGLTLATEAGFLSLTSVSMMFLIMFRNIWREMHENPKTWRLIQEPIDLYMLLLFAADFVQAVGTVLDIRWVHRGEVVESPYCTAQGAIQQLGETGVAMTTLVIAIHTFVGVWWRRGQHNIFIAKLIMACVWVFIVCFVAVGFGLYRNKDYVIPTPYWCWLGSHYLMERIFGEYIWLWLTLIFSVFTYIPLYFCSRGNIVVSDDVWWKFKVRRAQNPDPRRLRALGLIAYPLVYSVLILPVSIVRWIGFQQERHGGTAHIPAAATIGLVAVYSLSGTFNVVLLLTTRPTDQLLLFQRKRPPGLADQAMSMGVTSQGRLPDTSNIFQSCPTCGAKPLAAIQRPNTLLHSRRPGTSGSQQETRTPINSEVPAVVFTVPISPDNVLTISRVQQPHLQ